MEYLFVYGTLMKNENNDMSKFLSKNAKFYSKGYFYGELYDIGEYPGAITSKNKNKRVYGNIFTLRTPEKVFSILDEYEEVGEKFPFPNEYKRIKTTVYSMENGNFLCWIYLYNHSVKNMPRILSGDYLSYKALNKK